VLAAAVLAAGCVTPRTAQLPDISDWERRQAVLGQVEAFGFSGRIGVKYADDGFNGKLSWDQDGETYDARLSGPLGVGTVLLEGQGRTVAITDKDGVTTVLQDVEPELQRRYGWTIPVDSLRYWALGIPDPRLPAATQFAETGELERLEQRGWVVDISRYRDAGGGQMMPARLSAAGPGTTVRLVIDRWAFPGGAAP